MLRISKLTDYATVILSYLALHPHHQSARKIAEETHLAWPTTSKLLKLLTEAALVVSFRGMGGGYQLARSADKITLADILIAIEGPIAMTECCDSTGQCAIDSLCHLKENWQIVNKIILTALNQMTLQQMLQPMKAIPSALRGIPIKVV